MADSKKIVRLDKNYDFRSDPKEVLGIVFDELNKFSGSNQITYVEISGYDLTQAVRFRNLRITMYKGEEIVISSYGYDV